MNGQIAQRDQVDAQVHLTRRPLQVFRRLPMLRYRSNVFKITLLVQHILWGIVLVSVTDSDMLPLAQTVSKAT